MWQLNRNPLVPLRLRTMADIDEISRSVLDAKGLSMTPHAIETASGRQVATLLVNVKARFGSMLTAEWYEYARQQCPRGTKIRPFSFFWDPTVRMSTGAKYCVLQLYDHLLPLDVRFRSENVIRPWGLHSIASSRLPPAVLACHRAKGAAQWALSK